jgi:hypothetical protein
MDIGAIAIMVLQEIPSLIAAGQSIVALVEQTNTVIRRSQATGSDPMQADWDAINGAIAALKEQIDAAG